MTAPCAEKALQLINTRPELFVRQGALVRKQKGKHHYWVLRYYDRGEDGVRIQRSVYLGGDGDSVQKVREELEALRRERAELAHTLRLAGKLSRLVGAFLRPRKV